MFCFLRFIFWHYINMEKHSFLFFIPLDGLCMLLKFLLSNASDISKPILPGHWKTASTNLILHRRQAGNAIYGAGCLTWRTDILRSAGTIQVYIRSKILLYVMLRNLITLYTNNGQWVTQDRFFVDACICRGTPTIWCEVVFGNKRLIFYNI